MDVLAASLNGRREMMERSKDSGNRSKLSKLSAMATSDDYDEIEGEGRRMKVMDANGVAIRI
ncbi:hypothetical protein SESBI_23964 [Sesbania bispinosa]|nr:hypothetical protein SESBI_23964 [Sesbania bispinosa]